ncbi:AI-2E family transporter [Bradyrhizobium sp. LHD-71]|uniref:AI-2E family transporter n=1 Tax=Bradyrhizobium sp. LHD-71 TaxID=3072141 RepID=UPI00280DEBAF|nr:AI-2E family transporter [Bradyrhizobium sp. LHD-71]MDQ8726096.1 AI-2E family transporter [Bradyrhizobium sp. LHD-71]
MTNSLETQVNPDRSLAASIALGGCAIAGFVALLAIAWHAAGTILLLFSGVLFGIFLVALTNLLDRLIGGSHVLRLVIVCLFLTGLFTTVIALGGATIAQQATALSATIRSQVGNVRTFLEERGVNTNFLTLDTPTASAPAEGQQRPAPPSRPDFPSASTIASGTSAIVAQTWKVLSGLIETVGNIFIIILLGLLIAAQPSLYRNGALRFVPQRYKQDAAALADDIGETLRRWLMGQLMTMTSIFIITWIGLALIGIPGSLVLGFIAGFLSFIPNVGAVLAGVLIVLASLGSGLAAVVFSFGLYLLVQFLEGNILTPLIQRHAINIPPATLFAAQIFLGFLFGLWGLALALPMIAITNVVLKHRFPDDSAGAVPG